VPISVTYPRYVNPSGRPLAEALKTFFSPALVRRLATDLERVAFSFPAQAFIKRATAGLGELELLERGKHIARALAEHLPPEYPKAIDILLRSLGPEHPSDELIGAGMAPFFYLPHTLFVAERGLEHFELSLRAQYELTKRFSAEGSIRAFISKDPERTMAQLLTWTGDPNPHVRRLPSEGTRLRLPWAGRVAWLDANPARVLAILERLKSDPTTLVRRSVANNLNDLGKVHADLVVETCRQWLEDGTPETLALVRHALRSLVKQGHRRALSLLGTGETPRVDVKDVRLSPRRVRLGEELRFSFRLKSSTARTQKLAVDYVVYFVKANGNERPKVFKLRRIDLAGGESVELTSRISLADLTTRRHYAGKHRIEILVNGVRLPLGTFDVLP
jgi:3-methyladenine DNA glycosylase AlkC